MGGAASGKFKVKSCGNAHAWCKVCMPEQAAKLRKPKPPAKPGTPPCRKCGSCDYCLGLAAPEGMKICRECGETKLLAAFHRRADTGSYRNQCAACRSQVGEPTLCEGCGQVFARYSAGRTLCTGCAALRGCSWCGREFTGSMEFRRYCSAACRDAALKDRRSAAHRAQRIEALQAYGGLVPACACCGEATLLFLALDHVNGGGRQHHLETGGGGFYVWLRKNNYPEGFKVLCHNCNFGRQLNGGTCPHAEG
jgi:hypothetical protein